MRLKWHENENDDQSGTGTSETESERTTTSDSSEAQRTYVRPREGELAVATRGRRSVGLRDHKHDFYSDEEPMLGLHFMRNGRRRILMEVPPTTQVATAAQEWTPEAEAKLLGEALP